MLIGHLFATFSSPSSYNFYNKSLCLCVSLNLGWANAMNNQKVGKIYHFGKILFASFFIFAGFNHFIMPKFYYPLIPDYIPMHFEVNILSGILEILFGVGLILGQYRDYAAYGIVLLMFAFIPAHIHFIEIGGCIDEGLCVPMWIAWARLVIIHPILIFAAFLTSSKGEKLLYRQLKI